MNVVEDKDGRFQGIVVFVLRSRLGRVCTDKAIFASRCVELELNWTISGIGLRNRPVYQSMYGSAIVMAWKGLNRERAQDRTRQRRMNRRSDRYLRSDLQSSES